MYHRNQRTVLVVIVLGFASLVATREAKAQINLDSLKQVWGDETLPDSVRLKTIQVIAWDGFLFNNQDSAMYYAQLQYDLAEKKESRKWMASALNTQGVAMYYKSNYEKALDYHNRSMKIKAELDNIQGVATSLNNIGMVYELQSDYEKAMDYYNQSLEMATQIESKRAMANALNNMAIVFKFQGEYTEALKYYTRSLNLKEEDGYKRGMVSSLSNIGTVYYDQGYFGRAIENYLRALKISEELGDKQRIFRLLGNIGNVYYQQGDDGEAIDYHTRCLKIAEEVDNQHGIAGALNYLGQIYDDEGAYIKALSFYERGLTIREEIQDRMGTVHSVNKIGNVYLSLSEYSKAINYQKRGLKIANEVGYKKGIATSLNNLGLVFRAMNDDSQAIVYSSRSLTTAQEVGSLFEIKAAAGNLYEAHKQAGNHRLSLEMYELFVGMRDSIENLEVQREVLRQEFQYKYESQALADSIAFAKQKELDDLAYQAALSKEASQRFVILGSFVLILIFIGIYFRVRTIRRNAEKEGLLQEIRLLKIESVIKTASNDELKEQMVLDKVKIEESISNTLNPSDWSILQTLFDNPAIGNGEIADRVALSVPGVRSSLQKMYRFFKIDKSSNQRMLLVMEATKISNNFFSGK